MSARSPTQLASMSMVARAVFPRPRNETSVYPFCAKSSTECAATAPVRMAVIQSASIKATISPDSVSSRMSLLSRAGCFSGNRVTSLTPPQRWPEASGTKQGIVFMKEPSRGFRLILAGRVISPLRIIESETHSMQVSAGIPRFLTSSNVTSFMVITLPDRACRGWPRPAWRCPHGYGRRRG